MIDALSARRSSIVGGSACLSNCLLFLRVLIAVDVVPRSGDRPPFKDLGTSRAQGDVDGITRLQLRPFVSGDLLVRTASGPVDD